MLIHCAYFIDILFIWYPAWSLLGPSFGPIGMDLNRLDEEVPIFFGNKEYHTAVEKLLSDAGILTQKAGMLRGHSIPGCASKVLAQFPAVGCQVHCGDRTFYDGLRFVARLG